jgi:hypothetical protein
MILDSDRQSRTVKKVIAAFCCLALLAVAAPLRAQEDIDEEEPIPASVDEIVAPMDRLAEKKPRRPGFFPWLKEQLKDSTPFLRDTALDLNFRSFYMKRSNYNYDGSVNEAWAMGGALTYTSGWLFDRFNIGAALYTSQPVYAPERRDGTTLLAPGQKGYTVLGQLYGRVRLFDGTFLNLYRYAEFNSPYLSKNDTRMTPYSFEGYTVVGNLGGKESASRLVYGGGYILKIKDKTTESFEWMSEKAGSEAKRGVAAFGGRYSRGAFSLGAIDYYCDDIINIGYAETGYTLKLENGIGTRFAAQYSNQRSVGSSLLTGGYFSTSQAGIKTDVSFRSGIITIAYTSVARGYDIQNPWSGNPGYTSSMISNYKNAGTKAITTRLSYDFTRIGLKGVAAYIQFAHGWGMVDKTTKAAKPNENEFDADLQWRPTWRYLQGLWVRGRYGIAHQYEGPREYIHDCRMIVNYDFQLM